MDINRATIVGRLTRDPEVRTTPSGINVTSFSVATNFVWTDSNKIKKESVEYHNVVAWRKLGEIVAQYLRKGSRVLVEGRLQTRTWDGQDGAKRNRTEIVADNLVMLDSKGSAPLGSPAEDMVIREEPEATRKNQEDSPSDLPPGLSADKAGEAGTSAKEEEISVEDIPF